MKIIFWKTLTYINLYILLIILLEIKKYFVNINYVLYIVFMHLLSLNSLFSFDVIRTYEVSFINISGLFIKMTSEQNSDKKISEIIISFSLSKKKLKKIVIKL